MDINFKYAKDPICPFCGHEQWDCYELERLEGSGDPVVCDDCGKKYHITCDIDVTYHSEKVVEEE